MSNVLEPLSPEQEAAIPGMIRVWHAGAKYCTTGGLKLLYRMLLTDDPRLLQGATTDPAPAYNSRLQVEKCCPVSATAVDDCGGFGKATVGDVENRFAEWCFNVDQALGEPAGCRWFLNAWDELPRWKARQVLLEEVWKSLNERGVRTYDETEAAGATEQGEPGVIPGGPDGAQDSQDPRVAASDATAGG